MLSKNRRGTPFVFIALVVYITASPLAMAMNNIVRNAGFEKQNEKGVPAYWKETSPDISSIKKDKVQGRYIVIKTDDPTFRNISLVQEDLPMEGMKEYVLKYKVMAPQGQKYRVYLEWDKPDGEFGGKSYARWWPAGTAEEEWYERSVSFEYPKDMKPPRIILQIAPPGTASFDDIRVLPDEEANVYIRRIRKDGGVEKETGAMSLRNWYAKRREQFYARPSKGKNPKVLIRNDQILIINGQPRFPLWATSGRSAMGGKRWLVRLAEEGIRGIVLGTDHYIRKDDFVMELCRDLNLDVVVWNNLGNNPQKNDSIYKQVTEMTAKTKKFPHILGWMLDEPMLRGVRRQQVEDHFRILNEMDSEHFFWINAAPRGTVSSLERYLKNSADITGCDIYPIWSKTFSDLPNQTISCIGEYTGKMREAVNDTKPIIMMLEAANIGAKEGNFTFTKARFIYYDAIINGARGICFYTQRPLINPEETWSIVGRIVRELGALEPVLVAPRKRSKGFTEYGAIEVLHLNDGRYDYWFCANRNDLEVALDLRQLRKNYGKLKSLFERRKRISAVDTFGPYEVHVYTTCPKKMRRMMPVKLPKKTRKVAGSLDPETLKNGIFGYEHWKAQWIWMKGFEKKTPLDLYARKTFTVEGPPREGWLAMVLDNNPGMAFVNGKPVGGSVTSNFCATAYNILPLLKEGKNVIAVKAHNATAWASAFLLEAGVTAKKKISIASDSSWKVSIKVPEGWEKPEFDDSNWENASEQGRPPVKPWFEISIAPIKEVQ